MNLFTSSAAIALIAATTTAFAQGTATAPVKPLSSDPAVTAPPREGAQVIKAAPVVQAAPNAQAASSSAAPHLSPTSTYVMPVKTNAAVMPQSSFARPAAPITPSSQVVTPLKQSQTERAAHSHPVTHAPTSMPLPSATPSLKTAGSSATTVQPEQPKTTPN